MRVSSISYGIYFESFPSLATFVTIQVSSESGWSPDPEFFAKRQYKKTEWGWFPVEDAFGGGESSLSPASQR